MLRRKATKFIIRDKTENSIKQKSHSPEGEKLFIGLTTKPGLPFGRPKQHNYFQCFFGQKSTLLPKCF
jgi:hypothetical protein